MPVAHMLVPIFCAGKQSLATIDQVDREIEFMPRFEDGSHRQLIQVSFLTLAHD